MKRTIVWPDLQCPYEDQHLVRNFELFAKDIPPDVKMINIDRDTEKLQADNTAMRVDKNGVVFGVRYPTHREDILRS
jgi:hypothetical protein